MTDPSFTDHATRLGDMLRLAVACADRAVIADIEQLAADVAMLIDALAPLVDIVAERASGLGADDWARLEDGRQALALVDETQPPFRQGGRSDLAVRLNAMADGWLCAGLPDADLLRKAAREIERLHAALQVNAKFT